MGEGTSNGMNQQSVVDNLADLKEAVQKVIVQYGQEALVQQFINGKEFTVGILGDLVLPILEFDLNRMPNQPRVRDESVKEIDSGYSHVARFSDTYTRLAAYAAIAHTALSCRDYNRMDFRQASDGKVYFLEANPLPGLSPHSSDFPKSAALAGIGYNVMINAVLWQAILRYQSEPEYKQRFSSKRVGYLEDFVNPLQRLNFFHVVAPDTDAKMFRLVKTAK